MRTIAAGILLLLLVACDPYYELTYRVQNESAGQLVLKFKNYPDSVVRINPHAFVDLKKLDGVGYAREKYRQGDYQKWFEANALVLLIKQDHSMHHLPVDRLWTLSVDKNIGFANLVVNGE